MKTSEAPSETIARAERWRAIMDDGLRADLAAMRARAVVDWSATGPQDTEKREALYQAVRAISNLESVINARIGAGRIAASREGVEK